MIFPESFDWCKNTGIPNQSLGMVWYGIVEFNVPLDTL